MGNTLRTNLDAFFSHGTILKKIINSKSGRMFNNNKSVYTPKGNYIHVLLGYPKVHIF